MSSMRRLSKLDSDLQFDRGVISNGNITIDLPVRRYGLIALQEDAIPGLDRHCWLDKSSIMVERPVPSVV